ncbi:MAG: preprotein translocase subunit SecG [Gemmiger sp.]|nr:preprotein translocase subunit SecG [Gemmiger sp.]
MSVYEIVFGVILIAVSLLIIVFTLAQESKGQGLSAAIMGDNSIMAAGRERGIDAKMAQVTKVCGAIFFIVAIVVCVLSARLG